MPIYNSWKPLHLSQRQEIKFCAELLLELAKKPHFSLQNDGSLVIEGLNDLNTHSKRLHLEETYHPLLDIRNYFNKTLISYRDKESCNATISLERAVSMLNSKSSYATTEPLLKAVVEHIREELRPSGPLYLKLIEVCRHQ